MEYSVKCFVELKSYLNEPYFYNLLRKLYSQEMKEVWFNKTFSEQSYVDLE